MILDTEIQMVKFGDSRIDKRFKNVLKKNAR
jgi:hypothetical protein